MGSFIMSMLSGPTGEISSKRVAAFMLIIAAIVYAFVKSDPVMCAELIGGGCALLGVAAFTKS